MRRKSLLIALLAVVSLLSGAVISAAQPTVVEEFETANQVGWAAGEASGGQWTVRDGSLVGTGHAWYLYAAHDWTDLQATLEMTLSGPLHINLRVSEAGRYRLGLETVMPGEGDEGSGDEDDPDPYDIEPGSNRTRVTETTVIMLISRDDHTDIVWDEFTVEGRNPFLTARASVQDGLVTLNVNDRVLTWQDPDPLPPGAFGVESLDGTEVAIDRMELTGVPAVDEPDRYDLAIERLEVDVLDLDRIEARVEVLNAGDLVSDDSTVFLEFDGDPLASVDVAPLEPQATRDYTETLDVPDGVRGEPWTLTALLEPADDDNPGNNSRTALVVPPSRPGPGDPPAGAGGGERSDEQGEQGTGGASDDWWWGAAIGVLGLAGMTAVGTRAVRRARERRSLHERLDVRATADPGRQTIEHDPREPPGHTVRLIPQRGPSRLEIEEVEQR